MSKGDHEAANTHPYSTGEQSDAEARTSRDARGERARVAAALTLPEPVEPEPFVPEPSSREERHVPAGMGAIVEEGAVSFRVWAPSSDAVFVTGTFDDWSKRTHALSHEADGYWSGRVAGAKVGDEYRFVLCRGDEELLRNDPYARQVTDSAGNSVVTAPHRHEGPLFITPPWNELVIYELHIGTFHRPSPDEPGTFYTAIERLDYLVELGVNAVEVMPSAEFPGDHSWGYDLSHPFAVESAYGGPDGLRAFVHAAHQRGLAVIMDVVFNHFGPMEMDLWRFDGWHEGEGGGIYFYNDHRAQTPWGHTRPDYGRPEVRQYLRDNALLWLEEYQVDGLRVDALSFVQNIHGGTEAEFDLPEGRSLMRAINAEIQQKYPHKFLVAEDVRRSPEITAPLSEGGQGFSSQWDVTFVNVVREELTPPDDRARNVRKLADLVVDGGGGSPFRRTIYSESHDDVGNGKARLAEQVAPGDADGYYGSKRALLGLALALTSPGVPMLFQGQGLNAPGTFDGMPPLDWSLLEHNRGHVQAVRDLVFLRRDLGGVSRGLLGPHAQIIRADDANKVLVFQRWFEGGPRDTVVVAMNLSARALLDVPVGMPNEGAWRVRYNSDWRGYHPEFDGIDVVDTHAHRAECDGMPFVATLNLPPYAVVVLSQD